jgi:hypothetical protein
MKTRRMDAWPIHSKSVALTMGSECGSSSERWISLVISALREHHEWFAIVIMGFSA